MTTDSTKESDGTMKPTKYRYRHTVTIKEKHEHVIDLESSDGRVFGMNHDGFKRDYAPVTQDATAKNEILGVFREIQSGLTNVIMSDYDSDVVLGFLDRTRALLLGIPEISSTIESKEQPE